MGIFLRRLIVGFFICLILALPARANQFDNEGNFCRLYISSHELMISSYQPDTSGDEIFCSNLPAFSKTIIVFDLVNETLRNRPLEIKLIESPKTQERAEHSSETVITAIPLNQHTSGSVQLSFTPKEGHHYAALINIHEEGQMEEATFPLSIAEAHVYIAPSTLTATALTLMTLGVIFIFVRPLITKILSKRG